MHVAYIVEDEITDNDQVKCFLAAEDGQHVLWHPLPKVNQEILNFVEIGPYHAVENALAVSTVHEEESLCLQKRAMRKKGLKDYISVHA